jgi:hypothetical protein
MTDYIPSVRVVRLSVLVNLYKTRFIKLKLTLFHCTSYFNFFEPEQHIVTFYRYCLRSLERVSFNFISLLRHPNAEKFINFLK